MTKNEPRKALGKGIGSLLPRRPAPAAAPATETALSGAQPARERTTLNLPIDQIKPNEGQPRYQFNQQALDTLAQSISRDGVIQPIVVRLIATDHYQIVAGERRYRAALSLGLKEIPAVIREVADDKILELALIENVQREDLNPVELARAFQRMADELSLSHEEIGYKTGKDRATVTNTIRLLQLAPAVQDLLLDRKLTPGHARALLKIQDEAEQVALALRCIAEDWSVRQIENFTKPADTEGKPARKTKPTAPPMDPNVKAAVADMEARLGTRVRLVEKAKDKGLIEIEYYSAEDLDRIYAVIAGEPS